MNEARLLTKAQRGRMLANGRAALKSETFDPRPVVKLFAPDAGATWLLSEIDPNDHDQAFGLCDLGVGSPELGWVSLKELESVRIPASGAHSPPGLPIERDLHFRAEKCLAAYARDARHAGRIVT